MEESLSTAEQDAEVLGKIKAEIESEKGNLASIRAEIDEENTTHEKLTSVHKASIKEMSAEKTEMLKENSELKEEISFLEDKQKEADEASSFKKSKGPGAETVTLAEHLELADDHRKSIDQIRELKHEVQILKEKLTESGALVSKGGVAGRLVEEMQAQHQVAEEVSTVKLSAGNRGIVEAVVLNSALTGEGRDWMIKTLSDSQENDMNDEVATDRVDSLKSLSGEIVTEVSNEVYNALLKDLPSSDGLIKDLVTILQDAVNIGISVNDNSLGSFDSNISIIENQDGTELVARADYDLSNFEKADGTYGLADDGMQLQGPG
jgi:hypothetical protein